MLLLAADLIMYDIQTNINDDDVPDDGGDVSLSVGHNNNCWFISASSIHHLDKALLKYIQEILSIIIRRK